MFHQNRCCWGKEEGRKPSSLEPVEDDESIRLNDDTPVLQSPAECTDRDFDRNSSSGTGSSTNDLIPATAIEDLRQIETDTGCATEPPLPLISTAQHETTTSIPCHHGCCLPDELLGDHMPGRMMRQQAVHEMLSSFHAASSADGGVTLSACVVAILQQPEWRSTFDEHLLSCLYATATNEILDGNLGEAFVATQFAVTTKHILNVGKDEFIRVLDIVRSTSRPPGWIAPEWYHLWNRECINICNRRDVILELTKVIPCRCLDTENASVQNELDMKCCHFCTKHEATSKLVLCTRCKAVRYCSKECQKQDWDSHKHFCLSLLKC